MSGPYFPWHSVRERAAILIEVYKTFRCVDTQNWNTEPEEKLPKQPNFIIAVVVMTLKCGW